MFQKALLPSLFLLVSAICLQGQNNTAADAHMLMAEQFKKNAQPDSAVIYYGKAAGEFRQVSNIEGQVNAFNQMGILLTRQDEYDKARINLEKALSIGLLSLDSNHLSLSTTYITLGVLYAAEEKYDQSLKFHNKALSIRLFKLGEYHADVATSYGNIGNVCFRSGQYDESIENHLKALKIREKVFGKTSVEIVQSYTNLGNAYREKEDYKTALEYFDQALQIKIKQLGPDHKDLARFYENVKQVQLLMNAKDPGEDPDKTIRYIRDQLQKGELSVTDALTNIKWMSLHSVPAFREVVKNNARAEKITLTPPDEPGLKITVKGIVTDRAGKPMAGLLVYVYQTSAKGWYADTAAHVRANEGDMRHARLFGYLKTDLAGQFEFQTIRPEGYPNSDLPAHIHVMMWTADGQMVRGMPDEFLFEEDKRLTPERKAQALRNGFLISKNTGTAAQLVYEYKLVQR